jgi:hypothetical protein
MPKYKVRTVSEAISTHRDYTINAEDELHARELISDILDDSQEDHDWEITEVKEIGD